MTLGVCYLAVSMTYGIVLYLFLLLINLRHLFPYLPVSGKTRSPSPTLATEAMATPETPVGERQLIDASGSYSGKLEIPTSVASSCVYGVVAVIGCQSSGKSTLLNACFGTAFPVLNAASRGRRRTTLGVWGALTSDRDSPLVVLDTEGADSRERGDGARSFESRTALLAVALSDVVVVNMWAHDIGRYSAANYELFETVFAHAVLLRKSGSMRHCVRILVAIRDYDGLSDVAHIQRVLLGDLKAIWERVQLKNMSFDELFKISFATLPHLKYAKEQFSARVIDFRNDINNLVRAALVDSTSPRTPLAAFDALSSAIWLDVSNATGGIGDEATFTLDVPKHAALAAHYSLGHIVANIIEQVVVPPAEELRDELEQNWTTPMENYASRVLEIVDTALQRYDELARPIREADGGAEAGEVRRRELGQELVNLVSQLRERYLWVCRDSTMTGFEEEFGPLVASDNGYLRQARRIASKYIAKYKEYFEEAKFPEVLDKYLEEKDILLTTVDGYGSDPPSDETLGVNGDSFDADGPLLVDGPASTPNARMAAILALEEDSEDENMNEYAVDRFMKDLHRLVEEKRRMGEVMAIPVPRVQRTPWWKGLLMRGLMLLINYVQARQHHLASVRAQRQHEEEFPPVPTF